MTGEEKKVMKETIRCVKRSIKHDTAMFFAGYNKEGKQYMSFGGDEENMLNLLIKASVHLCSLRNFPLDDFINALRKYKSIKEEENEVRD